MLIDEQDILLMFLELGSVFPTLAIIEINMCSFLLNGPGLRLCLMPQSVIPTSGSHRAAALPTGKERSWMTTGCSEMVGCRTLNNCDTKAVIMTKPSPIIHARIVATGVFGSSWESTTARTST
jgi:hypothetical protein